MNEEGPRRSSRASNKPDRFVDQRTRSVEDNEEMEAVKPKKNDKAKKVAKLQKILDEKMWRAGGLDAQDEYIKIRSATLPGTDRASVLDKLSTDLELLPDGEAHELRLLLMNVIQMDKAENDKVINMARLTEKGNLSNQVKRLLRSYSTEDIHKIMAAIEKLHVWYYKCGGFVKHQPGGGAKKPSASLGLLYCKTCKTCMMTAKSFQTDNEKARGARRWYIAELSFEHGIDCKPVTTSLQKAIVYDVPTAILSTADSLSGLSERWWNIVKNNDFKDAILHDKDPEDERFYGVFFLELPCFVPGCRVDNFYIAFHGDNTEPQAELRALNFFFAITEPDAEELLLIKKLVTLLLEDLKFVKKIHKYFEDGVGGNRLYLANVGFLAGGKKAQQLHWDCRGLKPTDRGPTTPFSVMLPIGKDGRNIHVNSNHREEDLYHIEKGKGLIFNGNIPHGGAVSESRNKLNNLALHIHVDRLEDCRKPNILQFVDEEDKKGPEEGEEEPYEDEKKPAAKRNKKKKTEKGKK